jgi:hypothetical protein
MQFLFQEKKPSASFRPRKGEATGWGEAEGKVHSIKTSNEFYNRAVFQRSQLKGSSLHIHTHISMLLLWKERTLKMVKVGVMWYLQKDSSLISDASRIQERGFTGSVGQVWGEIL